MKKFLTNWKWVIRSGVLGGVTALLVANCSSNNTAGTTTGSALQIERLARPAINEGLVRSQALLNAFNSVAPSVDLTTAAAPVVTEAANTLVALYAAVCYLNGPTMLNNTLKPLVTCPATGASIFGSDGKVTSNAAFMGTATSGSTVGTGALGYATLVAGQFLPDVMRIDTSVTSGYFTAAGLCNGGAAGSPLLCGGRLLSDPVIDITYAYLLHGGQVVSYLSGGSTPFIAPISNGVFYPTGALTAGSPSGGGVSPLGNGTAVGNSQQGHPAVLASFPFAAAPY